MTESEKITFSSSGQNEACTELYEDTISRDVANDYILPDYLPDVVRLLKVSTEHHISEDSGQYSFSGEIYYHVIYLCDKNEVHHILYRENIDGELRHGAVARDAESSVRYEVTNVEARLVNPRKLSLRCKLSVITVELELYPLSPELTGNRTPDVEASLRCDTVDIKSVRAINIKESGLPVSENIDVDKLQPEISELILCTVSIMPGEVSCADGSCTVYSEAIADCVYIGADGTLSSVKKRFSISDTVEHPNISDLASAQASACVGDIKAVATNDAKGEMRVIELDFTYDVSITLFENESCTVTRDVYSTAYSCVAAPRDTRIYSLEKVIRTNFSHNVTVPWTELGASHIDDIVVSSEELARGTIEYDSDKCKHSFTSSVLCDIVAVKNASDDGEGEEYLSFDAELPVKFTFALPDSDSDYKYISDSGIQSIRYRTDESGLHADIEIVLSIAVIKESHVSAVCECRVEDILPEREHRDSMLLYYPYPGERIWDVAKRYHVTEEELREANDVGECELCGDCKVLIIPTGGSDMVYSQIVG